MTATARNFRSSWSSKAAVAASAQPHRLFEHRVEHRREVAGRGIDDLQYLGGRGLLVARFFEFGAAGVELPPQFGIGFFELGHRSSIVVPSDHRIARVAVPEPSTRDLSHLLGIERDCIAVSGDH